MTSSSRHQRPSALLVAAAVAAFVHVGSCTTPAPDTPVPPPPPLSCLSHISAVKDEFKTCIEAAAPMMTPPVPAPGAFEPCPCASANDAETAACTWEDHLKFIRFASAHKTKCASSFPPLDVAPEERIVIPPVTDDLLCMVFPSRFLDSCASSQVEVLSEEINADTCACYAVAYKNITKVVETPGTTGQTMCSSLVSTLTDKSVTGTTYCDNCTAVPQHAWCHPLAAKTVTVPAGFDKAYSIKAVVPAGMKESLNVFRGTIADAASETAGQIREFQVSVLRPALLPNGTHSVFFRIVNLDPQIAATAEDRLKAAVADSLSQLNIIFQTTDFKTETLVEETKPPKVVTVIEETDKVPAYMVVLVVLFGVLMLVLGGGLIYMIISRGEGEDAEYDDEEMDEQGEVPAKALPAGDEPEQATG